MFEIKLSLFDISSYLNLDLATTPVLVLESKLKKLYGFLPPPLRIQIDGDNLTIVFKSPSSSQVVESKRLTKKAAAFASTGSYIKAVELYNRAIELNPGYSETRRDLAMVYSEINKITQAIDNLIEALLLNPRDTGSLVVLANLFLTKKMI